MGRNTVALALSLFVAEVQAQHLPWKGTNYLPGTTMMRASEFAFLSYDNSPTAGTYSPIHVESELDLMVNARVQDIRVFGSFYSWLIDRADCEANLAHLAAALEERGLGLTFVLWSSTSTDVLKPFAFVTQPPSPNPPYPTTDPGLYGVLHSNWICRTGFPWPPQWCPPNYLDGLLAPPSILQTLAEPYQYLLHDEPGNDLFAMAPSAWPSSLRPRSLEYVQAVAQIFAARSGLDVSFDLFNEPDAIDGATFAVPAPVNDFIKETYSEVVAAFAGLRVPGITVGFASETMMVQNVLKLREAPNPVTQTFLSFHAYGHPTGAVASFAAEVDAALAAATTLNTDRLDVVCTEFYDRAPEFGIGNMDQYLAVLDSRGIGGCTWGLLSSNVIFIDQVDHLPPPFYLDGLLRTFAPNHDFTQPVQLLPNYPPAPPHPQYDDFWDFVLWR